MVNYILQLLEIIAVKQPDGWVTDLQILNDTHTHTKPFCLNNNNNCASTLVEHLSV